jgi:hypothetical protein
MDEGSQKRKPYLKPYTTVEDERFSFLEELLLFFIEWKQSIQQRDGFSQAEKNKMFITHHTFKGMCMTLRYFPEACKYLLSHGVEFVLSNCFCQDPLEKHFYNETKLRMQRSLANVCQPRGNISRQQQHEPEEDPVEISCSPMKRKKNALEISHACILHNIA